MEKRITRTDYLFASLFIFMLVCILGAFFFGVRTGQNRVEAQIARQQEAKAEAAREPDAYEQQVLVSFYHTIYLPYREFEQKWFQTMSDLELNSTTVDSAAQLKELGKVGEDKYAALQGKSVPSSSPLLVQAQENYMKGLKLFGDALKETAGKANSVKGAEAADVVGHNAFSAEAESFVLQAQKDYFDAIVKWNQSIDANFKPVDPTKKLTLTDWGQLSLNNKNEYLASLMLSRKWFEPFKPHDLTLRIDEFIASGQPDKLKVDDVQGAAELLVGTDAVRFGDFIRGKQKFYANETLPQLPFFFGQS